MCRGDKEWNECRADKTFRHRSDHQAAMLFLSKRLFKTGCHRRGHWFLHAPGPDGKRRTDAWRGLFCETGRYFTGSSSGEKGNCGRAEDPFDRNSEAVCL